MTGTLSCLSSFILVAILVTIQSRVSSDIGRAVARSMQTVYFATTYSTDINIRMQTFLYVSMPFEYLLLLAFHVMALKLLMMYLMISTSYDLVKTKRFVDNFLYLSCI